MYTNAKSVDEATAAKGEFRAGGTDLQERLRSRIASLPIVDIQHVKGLDRIEFHDQGCTIGALTTIDAVGANEDVRSRYPALALPALTLATPQIRNAGTMGGVLCQRTRCWYYRHPELGCPKKGNSDACSAREGNHHFGVCFDLGPCVHPHPSTIGAALLTYDAKIEVVNRGRITMDELFGDGTDPTRDHCLNEGELITHVHLSTGTVGERAAYQRQMSREWAEWPLVEVVVRLIIESDRIQDARIAMGGVANRPIRLPHVEARLQGQTPSDELFRAAAEDSIANANPLPQTEYKLPMVVNLVRSTLEAATVSGA